ncbi:hypothetical protein JCM10369A_16370 [Nocardioides pyridinolyticus]
MGGVQRAGSDRTPTARSAQLRRKGNPDRTPTARSAQLRRKGSRPESSPGERRTRSNAPPGRVVT